MQLIYKWRRLETGAVHLSLDLSSFTHLFSFQEKQYRDCSGRLIPSSAQRILS